MDRALQQGPWTSPRYEIIDNNEKFQLTIEVPGVKMEDIDVSLEEGVLTVSGKREAKDDEKHYRYSSQFSQSFSIDPSVEVDKFTANLNNGVLVVGAPKDLKKIEESVRKIVVNQLPDDEVKQLDSKVEIVPTDVHASDLEIAPKYRHRPPRNFMAMEITRMFFC